MSSEIIAQNVYTSVLKFLETMVGVDKMSVVSQHINKMFPTWTDAWKIIYNWLQEHPLTNMQKSIHSFAQLFPNYESFATELDTSLVLHDEFWNQVHTHLCVAKSNLKND